MIKYKYCGKRLGHINDGGTTDSLNSSQILQKKLADLVTTGRKQKDHRWVHAVCAAYRIDSIIDIIENEDRPTLETSYIAFKPGLCLLAIHTKLYHYGYGSVFLLDFSSSMTSYLPTLINCSRRVVFRYRMSPGLNSVQDFHLQIRRLISRLHDCCI